jgi:hypothetical protein
VAGTARQILATALPFTLRVLVADTRATASRAPRVTSTDFTRTRSDSIGES